MNGWIKDINSKFVLYFVIYCKLIFLNNLKKWNCFVFKIIILIVFSFFFNLLNFIVRVFNF